MKKTRRWLTVSWFTTKPLIYNIHSHQFWGPVRWNHDASTNTAGNRPNILCHSLLFVFKKDPILEFTTHLKLVAQLVRLCFWSGSNSFFFSAHTYRPTDASQPPLPPNPCAVTSFNLSLRSVAMSATEQPQRRQTFGWIQSHVKHSVVQLRHAQIHNRPPAIFISHQVQPVESASDWVSEWGPNSEKEGQQGFKWW